MLFQDFTVAHVVAMCTRYVFTSSSLCTYLQEEVVFVVDTLRLACGGLRRVHSQF